MEQFFNTVYAAGHKSFDLSIERLIALLRVTLACFCLIVLATTPGLRPQYTSPFELILAIYVLFGFIVAALAVVARFRMGWQLPVHLIDLCIISILVYFVQPLSTTFLVLYLFVYLSATFRWNWRGALWTTVGLMGLQAILTVTGSSVPQFIGQWFFLVIIGGTFVFFGASRERAAEHLAQISAWPSSRIQSYIDVDDCWLDSSMRHIATVMRVPRVLVLWEIVGEPYSFSAHYADGVCRQDRDVADRFDDALPEELANLAFATNFTESNECLTSSGIRHCIKPVVSESFRTIFRITDMCSAPISGDVCNGRVVMFGRSDWGNDDIVLAEIIASRLQFELEYYAISLHLQDTAVNRDRIRLAHDLHDGILQSLTAARLQLAVLASHAGQGVRQKLNNIQKLLQGEQRHIRAFIDTQRLPPGRQYLKLRSEIDRQIKKIMRQWKCIVQLSVKSRDATLSLALARQIELILAEAAANAVQHGSASHISVVVESLPDSILLRITDNGRGLARASGSYSLAELIALGLGPQSICKRVSDLGGVLSLATSTSGVELSIELPRGKQMINKDERLHAVG